MPGEGDSKPKLTTDAPSDLRTQTKSVMSRDTPILPRKLDWLLTERLEDIKAAMVDNGTFISFPLLGSQGSLITVYGDQRVNIERTIRSVMSLVRRSSPPFRRLIPL